MTVTVSDIYNDVDYDELAELLAVRIREYKNIPDTNSLYSRIRDYNFI